MSSFSRSPLLMLAKAAARRFWAFSVPTCCRRLRHPGSSRIWAGPQRSTAFADDSMMITHITGDQMWDLLLEAARAGRWAIMPVGCPVFVFDEAMLNDLPEVLRPSAQMVSSGAELLAAIRAPDHRRIGTPTLVSQHDREVCVALPMHTYSVPAQHRASDLRRLIANVSEPAGGCAAMARYALRFRVTRVDRASARADAASDVEDFLLRDSRQRRFELEAV